MGKSAPFPFVERRSEKRHRIGQVLVKLDPGKGRTPFTCFVWDLSDNGARLKLPENIELPSVVHVIFGNVRKRATVIWREADHVGLSLLPSS